MKVEKIVVNAGVGEAGERLIKVEKALEKLTGQKPIRTLSKGTNKEWGLRKRMPIGCKVTLRKDTALKFLKDALWARDNKLPHYSFDDNGNVSFGISDYTLFPGMKYDPNIGIFGMDISVCIEKPGARIKHRRRCKRKLPIKQRVKRDEAVKFMEDAFKIEVIG